MKHTLMTVKPRYSGAVVLVSALKVPARVAAVTGIRGDGVVLVSPSLRAEVVLVAMEPVQTRDRLADDIAR